jgi:hypothetical protein
MKMLALGTMYSIHKKISSPIFKTETPESPVENPMRTAAQVTRQRRKQQAGDNGAFLLSACSWAGMKGNNEGLRGETRHSPIQSTQPISSTIYYH